MRIFKSLMKNALIAMLLVVMLVSLVACRPSKPELVEYPVRATGVLNKIHFLNVENADCIILESNGHIAVIDCAEDSDNPTGNPETEYRGYEGIIANYIKHYFANSEGKVHIDFILGTHAHSDHLGGFDTLILDEDITIDVAYLKKYYPDRIREKEVKNWDNQEVYDQMIAALETRGVPLVQDLPIAPFALGDYMVQFLNTKEPEIGKHLFENDNSVATYVTLGDKKILLMSDVNNYNGDEVAIGNAIGKVDLLKVGHHGNDGSTTYTFMKKVKPKYSILTGSIGLANKKVLRTIKKSKTYLYSTVSENGIVVDVTNEGLTLYKNAMKY